MGIYSLYKSGRLKVWQDLFNRALDDKAAPDLGDVIEGSEPTYADPEQFFARTYVTKSMENLIYEVADALENEKGGTIFLLTSLYGGGKTHMMITLYHAFSRPETLKSVNEKLARRLTGVNSLVIAIDGARSKFAPSPLKPLEAGGFTIKTLWGMLAYRLGAYAKVMQLDSETAHPPFTDTLIDMLREPNRPVLILIDEILPHIYTISRAKELKEYADNLIMFMGFLARAVERSPKVALLISLQIEHRGDQIIEEEIFAGLAKELHDELHRETTRTVVPVSPTDVIQILKRRIFQEVPEDEARRARDSMTSVYKQFPELFGSESDWQYSPEEPARILTAKDTYPFHPKYIEVIQEFISRNRDLRRTRDAIRLTRKVVRRILKGDEDPSFIMPWHVDLRDQDIRNLVLTESRREFRDVASKDIVDEDGKLAAVAGCSRPTLALRMATAILLKVYTYETFKIPLRTFPTLRDVALMTFDPGTFSVEGLQPPDMKTILNEMSARLDHFNYQDGRYWFDPYTPIIHLVEKRATEILNGPRIGLYQFLVEKAGELLVRKQKRGERLESTPFLFSEKRTRIIGYGDISRGPSEIEDKAEHQLVVFVKPRENISDKDVEDLILRHKGGLRTYKNTVIVVLPRAEANFEKMLSYAAKIRAAEILSRELKEIFQNEEEIAKIRQEKLRQYAQEHENNLYNELLYALTCIAYPRMEGGRDTINYVMTAPLDAIIMQTEAALEDSSTGPKLRRTINFDDLTSFLKRLLTWDLVAGDKPIEFGKIVEVFFTNTAAPLTKREALEEAIFEGLRRLDVGVKTAGEIFWKKLGENRANLPTHLRDDSEILPQHIAAKEFAEKLLSKEGQFLEEGKLHIISYSVEFEDKHCRLKDLVGQSGWVNILREGVVKENREMIERGFLIDVSPSLIEVDEGKSITAKISVRPVGGYSSGVRLSPQEGVIQPEQGSPPFDAIWQIGPLTVAGTRVIRVEARGADDYLRTGSLQIAVRSSEEEVVVQKLDISHAQAKLVQISTSDLIYARMALERISQIGAKAKAGISIRIGDNLTLTGAGADLEISRILVQKISELAKAIPSLKVEALTSIEMDEPMILDSGKIAALNVLSEKCSFKLRVRRDTRAS